MKTYLQVYFDELKSRVLGKSNITQIVPADCYRLALEIKTETNKSISETTVKRVFGFASSIHQPSIYTLNALAEYCGFGSWNNFYLHMEQTNLQRSPKKSWDQVLSNAIKISLFSIQSNKHKCGIPYHKTIDREGMFKFIDRLHASNATVGILSGPVGHGKTIAVTRWVENQIGRNYASDHNDIFLFTSSLSLLQGTAFGYHSNRWLAHLLGMNSSELLNQFVADHKDTAPGNFYLIIDELHSDIIAEKQFHAIVGQFTEMVRHFAAYPWFRVILVLRTTTLRKYEALFRDTISDPLWFSALDNSEASSSTSIGAFSNAELYQLATNFNLQIPEQPLLHQQGNIIKIPLFLQYHYEHHKENMNLAKVDQFDEYLIFSQYIKKKIFNGVNTMAKQNLMEDLSDLVDYHEGKLLINKKQAYGIIKQYRAAYNDLLYAGILHENGTGLEMRQQTTIEFQSTLVVAYFKALKLFNQKLAPRELIGILDRSPVCSNLKTDQLKWLLLFYIEAKDHSLLNELERIPFTRDNPFQLVAFVCDSLHLLDTGKADCPQTTTQAEPHGSLSLRCESFVRHVLNQSCFHPQYENHVVKLLAFDLPPEQEIIVRSKLAVVALLRWEEGALLQQLEKLSAFPTDTYAGLAINSFRLLSYLYRYFKDNTSNQALVNELDKLMLRFDYTNGRINHYSFDILVYLLIKIVGNVNIARKYSESLRRRLEKIPTESTFEVNLTSLLYALYLLECEEGRAAIQCVRQLTNWEHRPVLRLLHAFYQVHLRKLQHKDYKDVVGRAAAICDKLGFKLLDAYCSLLLMDTMPKNEQLRQISYLKFQFNTPNYVVNNRNIQLN